MEIHQREQLEDFEKGFIRVKSMTTLWKIEFEPFDTIIVKAETIEKAIEIGKKTVITKRGFTKSYSERIYKVIKLGESEN